MFDASIDEQSPSTSGENSDKSLSHLTPTGQDKKFVLVDQTPVQIDGRLKHLTTQ